MHAAGAREPRRSGNPFLDDSDDDDLDQAGHSSGAIAVPGLALPASTTMPIEASQPSTADDSWSRQESHAQGSMPGTSPTDSSAMTQQSLGTAPAVEQQSPHAHSAVMSSDAAPASTLGMDRQTSRQHSGQVSSRAGQVSDRAGQVSGTMQQSSSGHMPTTPYPTSFPIHEQPAGDQPQKPSLSTEPAVLSNKSETAATATYTGAQQQGSIVVGSAPDRQANVPFMQEAVPVAKPDDRQPLPAAAPSQPNQAQAGTLQEVQALQPPEQGSQTAPHSLQRLDSPQQGESIRLGTGVKAQNASQAQGMLLPPVQTQAASRKAQAGMSTAVQGRVNRGSADPALPLQQPGSFPKAPPATASMPVYAPPSASQGGQQGGSAPREHQETGLEGMLGRFAPDSDTEEEEGAASAQDRQRFMKSLQSPDQGSSRSRNLVQGFGRMRAKAKDMLQAKNAGSPSGPDTRSAQPAPLQGSVDGASHTRKDVELGKRGRLARDMTLMFGLKKPTNQQ